jgi:hypothetical protein
MNIMVQSDPINNLSCRSATSATFRRHVIPGKKTHQFRRHLRGDVLCLKDIGNDSFSCEIENFMILPSFGTYDIHSSW